jgi:RNA recognition motif-containing protein
LVLKVVADRTTGKSKGFGFITFNDKNTNNAEASVSKAISSMNGKKIEDRPITVKRATARGTGSIKVENGEYI